ncbi:MAG: hypothetical protein K0S39_3711, partial [Paenibacillus sp.]|nr:hypothetical protein [Paenibacillus sp.]
MLPDTVIKTMHTLCHSLTSRSSVTVEAVYVYGSTALGDYIEGSSDIDFIAIIDGILSPSIIHSITKAHKEVEELLPNSDIMGAYIHREDLGKPVGEITSLLTYFNKQIHTDGKGADINPVTWWVLKNYGLRV